MIKKCEFCKVIFKVKPADVKRGWGRFCSKSCAKRIHPVKKVEDTDEDKSFNYGTHGRYMVLVECGNCSITQTAYGDHSHSMKLARFKSNKCLCGYTKWKVTEDKPIIRA